MAAPQVSRVAGAAAANPVRLRKPPAGYGMYVNVEVDSFETQRLLFAALQAVSGPSLLRFLEDDAHDWFQEEITQRFAYEGDKKSGHWTPLRDATIDIRRDLGYGDGPINRRTDELFEMVSENFELSGGTNWAQMDLPGTPPNPVAARKLETAQRGSNDNFLGYEPTLPRPVLAVDNGDMEALLVRLEAHIMYQMAGELA